MTNSAEEIIARARALVGAHFRPQGRDAASGLDCVGLILCAFGIPAGQVRRDYRLRGAHRREIEAALTGPFRRVSATRRRAGDVLLCLIAHDQLHLAIDCGASFIHADARLRRIVETPGKPDWPVIAAFRARKPKSTAS